MNLDFLNKIRRNHAIEHATITLAHVDMGEGGILGGDLLAVGVSGVRRRAHGSADRRCGGGAETPAIGRVGAGGIAVLRHQPGGGRGVGRRGLRHRSRQSAAVERHPAG